MTSASQTCCQCWLHIVFVCSLCSPDACARWTMCQSPSWCTLCGAWQCLLFRAIEYLARRSSLEDMLDKLMMVILRFAPQYQLPKSHNWIISLRNDVHVQSRSRTEMGASWLGHCEHLTSMMLRAYSDHIRRTQVLQRGAARHARAICTLFAPLRASLPSCFFSFLSLRIYHTSILC